MRRLLYDDMKVLVVTRFAEDNAKRLGCTYNRDYLDYHNHICPSCQKEMKIERHSNTVKNLGAIGMGFHEKLQLIYPYAVCKTCSKQVHANKADANKTENYILEKLGFS